MTTLAFTSQAEATIIGYTSTDYTYLNKMDRPGSRKQLKILVENSNMNQEYNKYTFEIKTEHRHRQTSFKEHNFVLPCRFLSDHTPTHI